MAAPTRQYLVRYGYGGHAGVCAGVDEEGVYSQTSVFRLDKGNDALRATGGGGHDDQVEEWVGLEDLFA